MSHGIARCRSKTTGWATLFETIPIKRTIPSAAAMTSAFSRLRNAWVIVLAFLTVLSGTLRADEGDDVLAFYLSKAPLVVAGEIVTADVGLSKGVSRKSYGISLKVTRVLKGKLEEKEIGALCDRFVRKPNESPEFLRANTRVILFLRRAIEERGEGRGWRGVDPWFAVQPATEHLERALARLADAPPLKQRDEHEDHEQIGEDTLRFYKSRSSLVVSGTIG